MNTLIAILLLLGSFFIFIAALGLNKYKDLYSRMHATTKASSFGILLLIIAVGLNFLSIIIWVKVVLIVFFIYLTAPLATHSIAKIFNESRNNKN